MFKHFPKTMKVLLGLAVIMIAIMYGYVWFNLDTGSEQAEEARQPADPETVTDHMLELSGTNYEEVTDEEGNTTGTFASTYVKYRAPDGTYQPIDTAITVSASEDYEYENITNVFQTQFSGQTGGDDKISFSVAGGRSLTFSFIEPQETAGIVDGSTISYPEVYDGLDAKYTVTNDKLIEELILNKEIVLDKVSQQIELNNVYFKQHNDGSVTFHDSRSGNIVFSMHQPYMYEKNNPEKSSYGVEYEFVANEAGYILNKKITETGKDWLATAEYPVVIDPGLDISFPYSRVIVEPTTNQQLEVTFEDSSTGEDGWFMQASTDPVALGWSDVCKMETGLSGNCLDVSSNLTGTYDCMATLKETEGFTCMFTHTRFNDDVLGWNKKYYYRVGTYGYADFANLGVLTIPEGYQQPQIVGSYMDAAYQDGALGDYFFVAGGDQDTGAGDANEWRIEKRFYSTGDLCTDAFPCDGVGFDSDGIISIDWAFDDLDAMYAQKIVYDNNYIYIAGKWWNYSGATEPPTAERSWRIERRRADNGRLCTPGVCSSGAFGTGYCNASPNTECYIDDDCAGADFCRDEQQGYMYATTWDGSNYPNEVWDMTTQGSNLFISGLYGRLSDFTEGGIIQKRNKYTGQLVTGFDGDGIYFVDYSSDDAINSVAVNGTYVFYGVNGSSALYRLDNGDGGNLTTRAAQFNIREMDMSPSLNYVLITGNYASGWYTRRYDTDLTSSISVTETTVNNYWAHEIDAEGDYVYVFGRSGGSAYWRVQKYRLSDLSRCTSASACDGEFFGNVGGLIFSALGKYPGAIVVGGDYFLLAGANDGDNIWRVEKRSKGTGALNNVNCSDYGCLPESSYWTTNPQYRYTLEIPMIGDGDVPVMDSIYYQQLRVKETIDFDPAKDRYYNIFNPDYMVGCYSDEYVGTQYTREAGKHFGYYNTAWTGAGIDLAFTDIGDYTYWDAYVNDNDAELTMLSHSYSGSGNPTNYMPDRVFTCGNYTVNGDYVASDPFYWIEAVTRARNPSKPIGSEAAGTSIKVQLDTRVTVATSFTNPDNTDYAIQDADNGQYLTKAGTLQAGEYWCDFSDPGDLDGGPTCEWEPEVAGSKISKKITIAGLPYNTCYNFRSKSRNRAATPVEGEKIGNCKNEDLNIPTGWQCEIDTGCREDCEASEGGGCEPCFTEATPGYEDVYDEWSDTTNYCTLADQPSIGINDVRCGYDETDGYYCDVTVNTGNNPNGTYYYIQYLAKNDATAPTNPQWNAGGQRAMEVNPPGDGWVAKPQNFIYRHKQADGVSCTSNYYYHYRVKARNSATPPIETAYSSSRNDYLPPCQPVNFRHTNNDDQPVFSIDWAWNAIPIFNPTPPIDHFSFHDQSNVCLKAGAGDAHCNSILSVPGILGFATSYNQNYDQSSKALTPNTAYTSFLRAVDARDRPSQPTAEVEVYTSAVQPAIAVSCSWTLLNGHYCRLTVSGIANNPVYTEYQIEYSDDGGSNWGQPAGLPGVWNDRDALGFKNVDGGYKNFKNLNCSTNYMYRMRAKNEDDPGTCTNFYPYVNDCTAFSEDQGLTPPCAPTWEDPNHEVQDLVSITWDWVRDPLADSYNLYRAGDNSLINIGPITGNKFQHTGLSANTQYSVYVKSANASGTGPPSATVSAYTSMQSPPANINFIPVPTEEIINVNVGAIGDYSNILLANNSGIMFNETMGNSGSEGEPGFGAYEKSVTATDQGLSGNTEYCYQAESCNGDCSDPDDTTGDRSGLIPVAPGDCIYTHAWLPRRPLIIRVDGTTMNLRLRSDDNPDYTQYAICVTKYNTDGTKIEKYVRSGGSIDFVDNDLLANPNCANGYDDPLASVAWGDRDDWGSDAGIDITSLDASTKYDFQVKARNGEDDVIDPNSTGCVADRSCVPTNFGSEATLFLVKNNVVGWAWSSNIGWVSFNCLNRYDQGDYSCNAANHWGLNTNFVESREVNPLEGYGWSASGESINDVWSAEQSTGLGRAGAMDLVFADQAGGSYLWVVMADTADPGGGRLKKFDADLIEQAEYLTDKDLRGIAYAKNYIWVTSFNEGKIYKINPADGIPAGEIDLSSLWANSGPYGITYDGQYLWVSLYNEGKVMLIDPDTLEQVACPSETLGPCSVLNNPQWLLADDQNVWVSNDYNDGGGNGYVSKINRTTGIVTDIPTAAYSYGLASDNRNIWVTHSDDNTISLIDIIDDSVSEFNPLEMNQLRGIAHGNGYMWVADAGNDQIHQLDIVTQQVINSFGSGDAGLNPEQVLYDKDKVWVSNYGLAANKESTLYKISSTVDDVKAGLGWVSAYKYVCANDSQKGCTTLANPSVECDGNACVESAGIPPDGITYGYCYDAVGNLYGQCSDNGNWCTWSNTSQCAVPGSATCLFDYDKLYTCSYTEGGPAKGSCALQAGDLCKAFTNASFNGVTHEIEGWLRILSLEDVGKQYDCGPFNHTYPCEWSWISMRGQYDDGFGNTGNYSTVGTEVDTQEYLGDPDVNPEEVPLYSLFGWAWGAETTDFSSRSIWLPPVNVNQNPRGTDQDDHVTDGPRMAVDSKGNPHFVWTNMRPSAPTQADIFYIKWDGTKWVNAAGIEYDPDNPDTTTIVNYGLLEVPTWSAFGPTLALDSDDNPHIAFSRMAAIYYLKWNSAESTWETADGTDREDVPATGGFHVSVGGGYGASLALDRLNIPYVAYSSSETSYNDIYFKKWDTSAGDWRSITGDSNNLNVSNSDPTASTSKHLVLSNETTQLPHIIWNERNCAPYGQIYYRKWDPGTAAWTDIDPSDGPDDDVQVNAGVTGLLGIGSDCEGYNPSFDLYENNTPGIAWIDSPHLLYRKWDAGADAWVSVTGDVGADQLQINDYYNMPWYFIPQVKIYDDKPNIAWSDRREWTPTRNDIFLRYWNPDADSGNGDWVTASGNYGSAQSQNDPNFNISNSPSSHSGAPELIMDRFGSQHVAWWEQEWSDDLGCDGLTCASFADCPATHPQCDYYGCPGPTPDGKCVSYEVQYSKFIPGRFQSGLGWLEVMPVGALIGIPWVETMYSNIYAQSSIQLAPPPRGSDDYTSTYLILADGSISGISSYYADTQTGPPTSGFYQPGLNSLIGGECNISGYLTEEACALGGGTWTPGAGFPLGQNVLDTLDIDGLITAIDGRNRFGHEVNLDGTGGLEVDISSSAIFNSVPNPVLDGKIYHFSGADHYVLDNEMTFLNGDYVGPPATSGNGLIVIDGDLEINANTYYDATPLDSATGHISELASVAIIVRGNVYINSIVDEIAGVFVALDNPGTAGVTEGVISTSRRLPATQTIVAAADDAYASKAGAAYTNAHNLGLLRFGTDTLNRIYRSYLRWGLGTNANDINIPPDSDIKSAKISLYSEGTAPLGDFTARIYLIDHNDVFDYGSGAFNSPPGPGSAIDLYEISTTNSVGYDLEVGEWNGAAGEENITPDIRTLVQKYISSDEYEQNYYNGTTSHLGIVIKEGDAVAGSDQHRTFSSFEGGNPAMIEIEFTPKQVQYDIPNFEDDTMAWGPGALEVDDVPDPIFGWDGVVGEEYKKAFLRFVGIDIPVQAEILDAHMRATIGTTNGITGFQVRQGLMADYPDFSTNPFSEPLTDDVSEIAQTIGDNEWVNGDVVYFRDVVTLVESFIDRTDYNPGVAGSSEFVMRLRRGSDSVEQTAGAGEYRSIGSQTSNLVVNYQLPLSVSGLFVAKGYNFDREYTRDLAPSEKIVYDGRVVANTPPGLSDFTSVLPVYQRVIP